MKKNILLSLSLSAVLLSAGRLEAAAFESLGLGARAASMGGSYAAVSGDYESVFYNPAGLVDVKEKVLHTEYRDLYGMGMLRYVTAGYIHPNIGKGSVGFSWTRLDTAGDASSLNYSENTLIFSYGTRALSPLMLGANFRYYRAQSDSGASGMGVDLGALYTVHEKYLTLGACVQDLNRTVITWDTGIKERLPMRVRIGASSRLSKSTLLSAQVAWQDDEKRSHHMGLEQKFFKDVIALRAGGVERDNAWRFSWGFGLRVKTFGFDYAWERHPALGDTHVFSGAFHF